MLRLRQKRGRLFACLGKAFRGSPLLAYADLVGGHKGNRIHLAEPDTLRITVTEVALDDLFVNDIEIHRSEGAHSHTGAASDAYIIIHRDPSQFFITINGLYRTDIHARRILALLTGHGDIKAFMLPFHDLYAASSRIGNSVMLDRAYEFAKPAACAFLIVYI